MPVSRRTHLLSVLGGVAAVLTGCASGPATAPAASTTTPAAGGATTAQAAPTASDMALTQAPDPLPSGVVNALIVGTDSASDSTNTDVLVLAQLSADRSRLTLVSIPRDCYVPISGTSGKDKVNAALRRTGVGGLRKTVSALLGGLPIGIVAQTNFTDFVALVNLFDGFGVANKVASSVTSQVSGHVTEFPAGALTLHGADWLIYVRQRHGLPEGDFDRGERHRAVITGLLKRAADMLVADPGQFVKAVTDAVRSVRLTGLSATGVIGLARALKTVASGSITSLRVPTTGSGAAGPYSDAVFVDAPALAQLVAGLKAGDVSGYLGTHAAG